ncbi:hypothetical protein, partial [Nonomuraea sp. NBC_00507]
EATTRHLKDHFDSDVADAIIGDDEVYTRAATRLGHLVDSDTTLAGIIADIAHSTDDGTADWLATEADSPGAWFFKQINDRT